MRARIRDSFPSLSFRIHMRRPSSSLPFRPETARGNVHTREMGLFSVDHPSPIFDGYGYEETRYRETIYRCKLRSIELPRSIVSLANNFSLIFIEKKNKIYRRHKVVTLSTSTSTYLEFVETLYTSRPEILKQLLLKICVHESIFRGACDKHFR